MKKFTKLVFASALLLATVSGCSNKDDATTEPGDGLSGKVVYWSMWNETEVQADALKYAVELFNEDHPNVEVEIQWLGRANGDIVGPALQAGEKIDIIDNNPYTANPTAWLDITDMMHSPAIGQEGLTVEESILPVLEVANREMQNGAQLDPERHFGVQTNPWVGGFFYNKDLFAQAGVTEAPTTWEEFLEVCEKLLAAGIAPITCDDAYMTMIPNAYLARLVGPETIAKLSASPTDPAWQSEEVKQAFAAMEQLSKYMSPNTATNKYPAGQQEFALGEAAMYLNASWMPGEVYATAGDDFPWGVFNFPTVEGGVEDASYVSLGGIPLGVSATTDNAPAATEFLRYVLSKDVQDYLANLGGTPMTVGSEWPGALEECAPIVEQARFVAGTNRNLSSEFVKSVFTLQMNQVLTGQTSADAAYKTVMNEAGKY